MRLFFHPTGPMVRYSNGLLSVSDLNPEINTKWTMSRTEMLVFGWRCIWAALKR